MRLFTVIYWHIMRDSVIMYPAYALVSYSNDSKLGLITIKKSCNNN